VKYKVGDKVKVKNEFDFCEEYRGKQFVIEECDSSDDTYFCHLITGGYGIWFSEEKLEPLVPTLAEIKEKKLTCVVHAPTRDSAEIIANTIPVDDEGTIASDWSSFWDTYKDNTCYKIVDGELYSYQSKKNFGNNSYTICEFSDLFPVGSTMVCGDGVYKHTENGIIKYKLVRECAFGGIATLKPRDESVSFTSAPYLDLSLILPTNSRGLEEKFNEELMAIAELISHITGISYENSINKLKACLSAFSNDGISAKNGGKNSMKFTFYVTEGTRVDKSCNGTIPTMTTNIELLSGNVFDKVTTVKGSATCDKADYDERQGVLEALANAVCGGEFEKRYKKAVKVNKDADLWMRTCYYCGKVFDTVEEKVAHDDWHVERKKARHERYLLRKRAKEIAFEEQAQKMAKEMIKEDK